MNDVNRLKILQDVIDRRLAATRLEISDRHCRRLLERYREHGPLSLGYRSVSAHPVQGKTAFCRRSGGQNANKMLSDRLHRMAKKRWLQATLLDKCA